MVKNEENNLLSLDIDTSDRRILTVFSVNWIELEILKILDKSLEPVYKGEMINLLRDKHDSIAGKPESSFYAIFDRLEKTEMILTNSIPGQGYKTFLEITERGQIQLRRALFWGISSIFEGMAGQLIELLNEVCVKTMGCLREMNFGVVSPNNPEFLVPEMCNQCVHSTDEDSQSRFNILLPFAKDYIVPYYQNIRSNPEDIPLKMDLLDRIMSVLALGFLSEKDSEEYIKEVQRILKPGGKVAFFELIEFESYLWNALKELTHGFQIFIPKTGSGELLQFLPEKLKSKVAAVFGEENVKLIFLHEIVCAIAVKK